MKKTADDILNQWIKNNNSDSYFAWLPCINPLRFSYFNPNSNNNNNLHKSYFAQFITNIDNKEGKRLPKRKFVSHSFCAYKDFFDLDYIGEFRYYFIAETNNNHLEGSIISTINNQNLDNHELDLIDRIIKINKLYDEATNRWNEGSTYKIIAKDREELNNLFAGIEKAIAKVRENPIKLGKNKNSFHLVITYEFILLKNGFLFFKSTSSDEVKNIIYEKKSEYLEKIPDYLRVSRDKKLIYQYIKNCFHKDTFHSPQNDALFGVFNFDRFDYQKDKNNRFKIMYQHQYGCLHRSFIDFKRKKDFRNHDPQGVIKYMQSMLVQFKNHLDDTYFQEQNQMLELLSDTSKIIADNEMIKKNSFLTSRLTSLILIIVPVMLLFNSVLSSVDYLIPEKYSTIEYYVYFNFGALLFAFTLRDFINRQLEKFCFDPDRRKIFRNYFKRKYFQDIDISNNITTQLKYLKSSGFKKFLLLIRKAFPIRFFAFRFFKNLGYRVATWIKKFVSLAVFLILTYFAFYATFSFFN